LLLGWVARQAACCSPTAAPDSVAFGGAEPGTRVSAAWAGWWAALPAAGREGRCAPVRGAACLPLLRYSPS